MFTPFNDFVTIRVEEQKTETASGLILPADVKERFGRGVVVAVGAGKVFSGMHVAPECKVGDVIAFVSNGQDKIEDLLVVRESEIVGKFN